MRKLIDTLIEAERLKRLDRTGWTLRGLPTATETVAAHSYGVAVTAMMLADELIGRGIKVDSEKVLRMAILHDLSEARLGDMPKVAKHYFVRDAIHDAERAVFADIVENCKRSRLYCEIFDEYEARQTLESQLVKVADVLDLLVEALALEKAGAKGLEEFWDVARQRAFVFEPEVQPFVDQLFETLLATRAEISPSS